MSAINAQEQAEYFLGLQGWVQTGTTYRHQGRERITWWRKAGKEFPQHFALWLERSGAVRLLTSSQDAAAKRSCGA